MKTNTKQFPKHHLFDFEVLEHMEKSLGQTICPPNLLKMAAFNLISIIGHHAPSGKDESIRKIFLFYVLAHCQQYCMNGGTCYTRNKCRCTQGFYGISCEKGL